MRIVYLSLICLLVPFVMLHDAWQGWRHVEQRGRLRQRLGFVPRAPLAATVWVHAVSVGEVQAAAGLVKALREHRPDLPVVVSTVTATGAQRARALFGESVHHCYLPYDLPGAVRRFLDRITPQAAVILETELWPTLYAELGRRRIPLLLGSARLSSRSVTRFGRVASLVRQALAIDLVIGAQTEVDAERFRAIGAPPSRVHVTGNIKYDLEIPPAQVAAGRELRARWGAGRPVWIAGSTHEGEEDAALAAHSRLRQRHPDALLLLVPRHPQRFDAVRSLLRRQGVAHALRSAGAVPQAEDSVYLIDTLGELQMFYAGADVAFVGGSLVPVGGHSLLEPAVLGLPILSGPYTHNAPDIAALLEQCGALKIVVSSERLGGEVLAWFSDPESARAAGSSAQQAVAANRGAVGRLLALLEPRLSPPAGSAPGAAGSPVAARSAAPSGSSAGR